MCRCIFFGINPTCNLIPCLWSLSHDIYIILFVEYSIVSNETNTDVNTYVEDFVVCGSTCCTSGYTLDNNILNGIYIVYIQMSE